LSTSRAQFGAALRSLFQQQQAGAGTQVTLQQPRCALPCGQLQPAAHIARGQGQLQPPREQLLIVVARRGEVVALRLRCIAIGQHLLVQHLQPRQPALQPARAQLGQPGRPQRGTPACSSFAVSTAQLLLTK
jgi:hypothetical protein